MAPMTMALRCYAVVPQLCLRPVGYQYPQSLQHPHTNAVPALALLTGPAKAALLWPTSTGFSPGKLSQSWPENPHSYLCVGFSVPRFAISPSSRTELLQYFHRGIPFKKHHHNQSYHSPEKFGPPASQIRIYASPLSAQSEDAFYSLHVLIHCPLDSPGWDLRPNNHPWLERCIERAIESPSDI